ncbi:translation initiation inhibitor UK114/IBM1, putative [Ixodes scapularis]|uniref:Translation initiation inhibitor UK114/IBM1, putative n=1 Tax=Ixodes scapularis TaxID=6945 RepID=B7Q8G9_IXOSC|nr:translation initiation inhibitor UK114/IBM1, putative [Ixodes scapularis]|eukprot:XP_002405054.1 translation initiation inhibitor UK114/IBM1, putative [Ixodes scapularis]
MTRTMGSLLIRLALLSVFCTRLDVGAEHCEVQREVVTSPDVAEVTGPLSNAIRVGCTMYISGQIGLIPETNTLISGGIMNETRQALTNLGNVLKAGRMSFKNVAVVTVYLADINDTDAFNSVYKEVFSSKYPARVVVEVSGLHYNARVELQTIAVDSRT